jgi:hypothetical protein
MCQLARRRKVPAAALMQFMKLIHNSGKQPETALRSLIYERFSTVAETRKRMAMPREAVQF